MEEREEFKKAIQELEKQRNSLGDAAVDAAIAGLAHQLSELDGQETGAQIEPEESGHKGERRVVTVLFCDVAGSTALAESMDPEAWTGIMKEAFKYLIEPVERYGGTVARLMGDAILAFFGAPIAHEDDPQRAVLAGLAIVEDIKPYREQLRKEKGIDFNVRVGINTGLAVVGDVGSETAGEYTAMGDAVNLAARMEQTAAPGTVQIAQDTYALVAPLFDFKELGGIQVKGKREPVLAYQVLGGKAEPGSLRGLAGQGLSSPLIGRDTELESALNAVDRLSAGQGGLLVIQGEAGIGKSRILAELHRRVAAEYPQVTWLEGHTISFGQTISYWPFQEILRSYAGINEEDDETAAWHKLESTITELFQGETAEIIPYLASQLAIKVSDDYSERVKYLDGEGMGRQVYRASWRFFQQLAEQEPLLLIFEDLHWMDASSAGLLEHLMTLVGRVPLLICTLSRPDPETPATRLLEIAEEQYEDQLTRIDLTPLSHDDSRHLVQNLLEIDGLPDQTRLMILDKADGNPFYLEEIIRDLIETGALKQEPSTGRWQATHLIEKVTVPDTIQGLLIARIDRLEKNLKRVVRRAAVIGRTFLYRVLNAVLNEGQDLEGQLEQLQGVELILEKERIPELEYIFKHALAQEAAYEGMLLQERRKVHAQVGAALETQMADRLDEFYGLLAYHYSAAENWEKAQEYLFKAGDQAGRLAADAEALTHYRQAMEAYSQVRGDDWEPFERAQLERKIGEAFFRQSQYGQARAYLIRSLALLGEDLPESIWEMRLALLRAILTQLAHRLFPRRFVRSMRGYPDPMAEELYTAQNALTWIEFFAESKELYLLLAISSLNASERNGFAYGAANVASTIAIGFDSMGQHRLARRYYHLAKDYALQVDPPRPVFEVEFGLGFQSNLQGDMNRSMEHTQRAAQIAHNTGDLRNWGRAKAMTALTQVYLGRLVEAVETSQESIAVAEEGSYPQNISWGLLILGMAQRRLGQIDEAIRNLCPITYLC
jgi:class 3 adenylate cyclase/tetratricopeptide (TPR) repeat protein